MYRTPLPHERAELLRVPSARASSGNSGRASSEGVRPTGAPAGQVEGGSTPGRDSPAGDGSGAAAVEDVVESGATAETAMEVEPAMSL
jgi:hypothetical protein